MMILTRAAHFGTAVHKAAEYDDLEVLNITKLSLPLWPCLKAWRKFKKDFKIAIEYIEPIVYSKKFGFAGRPDRIAKIDCIRSLIEIKTRPYKALTDDLQTAAYQGAWNERNPKSRVWRRYLVELKRDGTYQVTMIKGVSDYAIFLSAVALHKWKKEKT